MKKIAHRGYWRRPQEQNSLEALKTAFELGMGVETDLRSHAGDLVLSHDIATANLRIPRFEDFLTLAESHGKFPIFLNIKEDGLLPLLEKFRSRLLALPIVFFDMSVPQLVQYASCFPRKMLCTRTSDHEPIPSGAHFCDWIWVDGFERTLSGNEILSIADRYPAHSLVFVSPELHGRTPQALWNFLRGYPETRNWMICTDLFDHALFTPPEATA